MFFPCISSVYARPIVSISLTKIIYHAFKLFSCFVQQVYILHILYILRTTSRFDHQRSFILIFISTISSILWFSSCSSFSRIFLCIIFYDRLINLIDDLFCQFLSEFHHTKEPKEILYDVPATPHSTASMGLQLSLPLFLCLKILTVSVSKALTKPSSKFAPTLPYYLGKVLHIFLLWHPMG